MTSLAMGSGVILHLVPGTYVRHPDRPDWGLGQVQSAVGGRITVNFEHAGKQLINAATVALVEAEVGAASGTKGGPGVGSEP